MITRLVAAAVWLLFLATAGSQEDIPCENDDYRNANPGLCPPHSPLSPDADTRPPSPRPTGNPTPAPSQHRSGTPSLNPTLSSEPTIYVVNRTAAPVFKPTLAPSITLAPTLSEVPTTLPPSTWPPTGAPTLVPTTELIMFSQRMGIGVSFLVVLIAYSIHSMTKPSELASRGLDHRLYKIREHHVEKKWGCKYCGYLKNAASSPVCRQCGTNQLGEQEIVPSTTVKGMSTEEWNVHITTVNDDDNNDNDDDNDNDNDNDDRHDDEQQQRRQSHFLVWERERWHFDEPPSDRNSSEKTGEPAVSEGGGVAGRRSEVPMALSLSKHGFVVTEESYGRGNSSRHGHGDDTDDGGGDSELVWVSAQSRGTRVADEVSLEFLDDVQAMRRCFFPEKVAWFYAQVARMQLEARIEVVPIEYITAYPNTVLRDSMGLLTTITPLQVLKGRYKIQYVEAKQRESGGNQQQLSLRRRRQQQHGRSPDGLEGREEKWLQALFGEFTNPQSGVLSPTDDGSLDLAAIAGSEKNPSGASRHSSSALLFKDDAGVTNAEAKAKSLTEEALGFFTALGRAMAMAVVSRTFVKMNLSPVLCKLLLGRPVHFMDLLNSNQGLFQDLLKLMMLPRDGVANLKLTMPGAKEQHAQGGASSSSSSSVTAGNRLEFVHRKLEGDVFTRIAPQLAALRRGLFQIIPQEIFSVFDHHEFSMLLNGHFHSSTPTIAV